MKNGSLRKFTLQRWRMRTHRETNAQVKEMCKPWKCRT